MVLASLACGAHQREPREGTRVAQPDASRSVQTTSSSPTVYELEPLAIQVVTDEQGQAELVAYDARELLDTGNAHLLAGRHAEALAAFDQLLADFPDSRLAAPARYNAGLTHEATEQWDMALARYRSLLDTHPADRDVIKVLIRIGAVAAELRRWHVAVQTFETLLKRDDLSGQERVQGLARLGYVLIEQKDYVGAEEVLRSGLGYASQPKVMDTLKTPYYQAMSQYYLAQIAHRQSLAIPIRLPDKQTERDIEAKADRVLIAHDRYLETVRFGSSYWTAAAGYQIAALQSEFWEALVLAPVPFHLGAEAAAFYKKEVHRLSRKFLDKALAAHQRAVRWANTAGVANAWVDASRREAVRIAGILTRESGGELVVPHDGATVADPGTRNRSTSRRYDEYVPGRIEL